MSISHFRPFSALLGAVALIATASGIATAQNSIPGDNNPGTVVRVIPANAQVKVSPADASATQITGTFTNTTTQSMSCTGIPSGQSVGGTVTEATVVQASLEYYRTFAYKNPPSAGLNVAGSINIGIDLEDVPTLLPGGSTAPLFGAPFAARSAIVEDHAAAKLAGHTGLVSGFTVNAGATRNWTSTLGAATAGTRTDFQAGVLFVCSAGGTYYAFGGYEGAEPTPDPRGLLQTGSLGRN